MRNTWFASAPLGLHCFLESRVKVHSQVNGLANFNGHGFRHIDAGNGGAASG